MFYGVLIQYTRTLKADQTLGRYRQGDFRTTHVLQMKALPKPFNGVQVLLQTNFPVDMRSQIAKLKDTPLP